MTAYSNELCPQDSSKIEFYFLGLKKNYTFSWFLKREINSDCMESPMSETTLLCSCDMTDCVEAVPIISIFYFLLSLKNINLSYHSVTKYSNEILSQVRNIVQIRFDVCRTPNIHWVVQIVLNGPEIMFRKENHFLFFLTQTVCHTYASLSLSC